MSEKTESAPSNREQAEKYINAAHLAPAGATSATASLAAAYASLAAADAMAEILSAFEVCPHGYAACRYCIRDAISGNLQ